VSTCVSCQSLRIVLTIAFLVCTRFSSQSPVFAQSCDGACPDPVDVPADVPEPGDPNHRPIWVRTGVFADAGETLCIETWGIVDDNIFGGGVEAGPNGADFCGDLNPNLPDWYNDIAHLCLAGRVRLESDTTQVRRLDDHVDGDPCPNVEGSFLWGPGHIGEAFTMVADQAGWVELAVNDGDTANNSGSFTATICVLPGPTATRDVTWGRIKSLYR